MLGFSLTKILLLAAVIAAVWYGFKYLERQRDKDAALSGRAARSNKSEKKERATSDDTVDLVKDEETGAYVPADEVGRKRDGKAR